MSANSSSQSTAIRKFEAKWNEGKFVCVGLDSEYDKLPEHLKKKPKNEAIFEFNKALIDQTWETALCYKPNAAFYEGEGEDGLKALKNTVEYIQKVDPLMPVILDAKRADIGNTNRGYVKMTFEELGVDAITVNPYLGSSLILEGKRELETLAPFIELQDKLIIVLCRTSNPASGELQDLPISIRNLSSDYKNRFGSLDDLADIVHSDIVPLYLVVAFIASRNWNMSGNIGLVVGATYPDEVIMIRKIVPFMPVLMPGIGVQGADVEKAVKAGFDGNKKGLIINSSRGIIFASKGEDFAKAAGEAALNLHNRIANIRREV